MGKMLRAYRWPLLVSASLAALFALVIAVDPIGDSTTGDFIYCSVTNNSGILKDAPQAAKQRIDLWKVEAGERHGFPPVRDCRLYGARISEPGASTVRYQFVIEKPYPRPETYFTLLVIVLLPLGIAVIWKASRSLLRRLFRALANGNAH